MRGIDFETYLISAEEPVPRPICLSHYDGNTKGLEVGMEEMERYLKEALRSNDLLIAQNMRFEALVIDYHFPDLRPDLYRKLKRNQLVCTKVYAQLLNCSRLHPTQRVSLADLVMYYFKTDISGDKKNPDAWRMRYHELVGIDKHQWPEEAVRYAIEDSVWAYKIYEKQLEEKHVDISLGVAADIYLNRMGMYGILVDPERAITLERELKEKLNPWYEHLEKLGLVCRAKDKWKKNMNAFRAYVKTNVPLPKTTVSGAEATGGEVLTHYLGQNITTEVRETIQTYMNIMKYEKILSAFVPNLKKANPVIRTNYTAVVSTGRTSSSSTPFFPSVNIQQMPREVKDVTWDVRGCFIPRPGYKICSIDYSGLELSSAANQLYKMTGMHEMRDIINSGDEPVDIHSMLAYRFMNMKEKTKETYESFKAKKKESPYKMYRQLAKPINLGFPGGIGYDTMRSLLAKDNIYPKLLVLKTAQYEDSLKWEARVCRREGHPVRIRQAGFQKYELVYDELITFKQELFALYPDLEFFLKEGHKDYLNGKSKKVKNEFGEWEDEALYDFTVLEFERTNCMYTQVCNGLLMQCPAALGAKRAMCHIIDKYKNSDKVMPLAFIHDEIVFEILDIPEQVDYIKDVSEILIAQMQTVLTEVRIAVEAEVFDYWKKAGGSWSKTYWRNQHDKTTYEK